MSLTTYRISPKGSDTWALARQLPTLQGETGQSQNSPSELVQKFASKEAAIAWGTEHVERQAPCALEVIRRDGAIAFRRIF